VRRSDTVFLNGELWRAHTADGSPLVPGDLVRVEDVGDDLRLLVGSTPHPTEEDTA
jgi:membrane protein implicated in regulation of membrane protease activity